MQPYPFPPDPSDDLEFTHRLARFARSLGLDRTARRLERRAYDLALRSLDEEMRATWGVPWGFRPPEPT